MTLVLRARGGIEIANHDEGFPENFFHLHENPILLGRRRKTFKLISWGEKLDGKPISLILVKLFHMFVLTPARLRLVSFDVSAGLEKLSIFHLHTSRVTARTTQFAYMCLGCRF